MTRTTSISIIAAVFTAAALAACQGGSSEDFSDAVQFTDCRLYPGGEVAVSATLTNTTDETADMWVDYEITTPDGSERYGTGIMTATALAPGQSDDFHEQLPWSVTFTTDEVACNAISVEFTP